MGTEYEVWIVIHMGPGTNVEQDGWNGRRAFEWLARDEAACVMGDVAQHK